jgi:ankyrin repeat protein
MAGIDAQRRTPLHYAALADDTAAVRTLLSQGADPDAADRQGFTALHLAAQQGANSAAAALLAAGA